MTEHTYISTDPFEFEGGGILPSIQIRYHTSKEGFHGQKVIWICHALTADSDPTDWWSEMVGRGKFLDPGEYFIVCCNMLGSCYGSSGPTSINPDTGKPYLFDFPKVSVRDIVRSQNLVRESLGIDHIDLMVGSSIGGFQALEWSIMYPDTVKNVIFMATLPRVTPWLTALEESQRMALEADPTFLEAKDIDGGKRALGCARTIALLSYRCEIGYNTKQSEPSEDTLFPERACSYHRYQGKKFTARFDAYSYWYLSYSVDSENVGRGRGGVEKALRSIKAKSWVVSIDTDLIFPAYEMEAFAPFVGENGAPYQMMKSLWGHDGFLLEFEQIKNIMAPILAQL